MQQGTFSPLPGSLDGQHEQFHSAFQILQTAVEQGVFPGASLAVVHRGKLIALKALGRFTYDPDSAAVSVESIYDLASLTKVIATTAVCMILHERGIFQLGQPIVEVLPEFANYDYRRSEITFQMLLAHSSGLPAYQRLFETASSKEELIQQAFKVPLVTDPLTAAEYSDIGFILLGVALERMTGEPLNEFCRREIFLPLGLNHTGYKPSDEWKSLIPPAVDDQTFRHRVIQGEVHDENAWVMEGVAGHAGVFATARDVSVFTHCVMSGGAPLLRPETVQFFTRRQPQPWGTSRALGWDTPSSPSQSGRYFSPSSYGHLGYTGTSLWIDPVRQLSVTLLTNRTWPDCRSQRIKEIRPAFHDAVIEALS
ncbi:MAG TPA: serine hydrolase domain-containing protein [Candidatus Angelobacter sp.]|nr:serine hydrolase domain-containing protein [Candidatus Angelobacter sp.]